MHRERKRSKTEIAAQEVCDIAEQWARRAQEHAEFAEQMRDTALREDRKRGWQMSVDFWRQVEDLAEEKYGELERALYRAQGLEK